MPAAEIQPASAGPEQSDIGGEFDLLFDDSPPPAVPAARKAPGAVRALLFFTATFIATQIAQAIIAVFALVAQGLFSGPQLPTQAKTADLMQQLVRHPSVIFGLGTASLVSSLAITAAFVLWWDRRPFSSVGFRWDTAAVRQFAAGLVLGAVLLGAIFVVEAALGWLRVAYVAPLPRLLSHAALWLAALLPAAAAEEVMLRGYTFQALEEQWGSSATVGITAVAFGALHFANPHAGWGSFLGIVASGVLFGIALVVTRRLWLPIGLHAAWNLFEGPILGFPVSGVEFPSAIATNISGPVLWTGGTFGPEAGLLGVVSSLAGAAILLAFRRRATPL
jgi:membrane protease YdiL (CAAX protease family)